MRKLVFALILACAVSAAFIWWDGSGAPARAGAAPALQPIVIDFENLPTGPLSNQFAHLGVTFNHMTVVTYPHLPGFAHSGVKAAQQCFAQEFCTTPIELSFTSGQRRVKLWAGLSERFDVSSTVIMRALDASGAQIGQATTVFNPSATPQAIQRPLEIALPSAAIRRVVVSYAPPNSGANFLAVDDVEFDSAGPPPACPATLPPTLTFVQPAAGQIVQFNGFTLEVRVFSLDPLANSLTLTNVGAGGATRSTVLTLNNSKYGPIRSNDFLFPGLNTLTARFQDCRGTTEAVRTITYKPIPAGTRFELMSIEVTQATQDAANGVPLIADKAALARVFLRVQPPTGQTVSIRDVRGFLAAQRRDGSFLPGNVRALNLITATPATDLNARRLDFTASVNFKLPAAWTAAGDLHLSFRPDIKDSPTSPSNLPCTNCDNGNPLNPSLPLFVRFEPTRPLNLILAPYIYHPSTKPAPLTADLLATPAGALQWTNNVYPLPGSFPGNDSGINLLRILPIRTTRRNLQTKDGKDAFLADVRRVLITLVLQNPNLPPDTRLLAMVPCGCGGKANLNGNAGFVDTWAEENGSVVEENARSGGATFETYGALWAHELGHNFGREHAGNWHGEAEGGGYDEDFPFFHGGIGQPGLALITEFWRATPYFIAPGIATAGRLDRHAHDFMSYGDDDPLNSGLWVSPYTYRHLFDKFKLDTNARLQPGASLALTRKAAPTEKLVAGGRINADGTVELEPFQRVATAVGFGTGDVGEFSLELLDAKDRVLVAHRFDAQVTPDGEAGAMGFTEFVNWHADAQRIVLKRKETMLAERTISKHAPTVRVLSPNGGEWLGKDAVIVWEGSDADGDPLTYTVLYNNGTDSTWLPIATDVTETSITVDTSLWPGSETGRVRVQVTDGVHSAEDTSDGGFAVPEKSPWVAVLNAEADRLTGVAYDPEDGLLPASKLVWTSDRDGVLESGHEVNAQRLSAGNHTLTLTVTDSHGRTATAQVTKRVGRTPNK